MYPIHMHKIHLAYHAFSVLLSLLLRRWYEIMALYYVKSILIEISQCTAVLYNNWSLQMGQMGPKMTLGTLKMNGDHFPAI